MRGILAMIFGLWAGLAQAGGLTGTFASIDGGELRIEAWRGQPVLVVNTASRCGFTGQYAGLQALYGRYRAQGLVVLAVPSDDFRQELSSAEAVKRFCEIQFGLDLPMTDISRVTGADAHPFYRAVRQQTGFVPRWNFNKILLDGNGDVLGSWGARVRPDDPAIIAGIEQVLAD
ncbi:MAG: glutathione peroxidase [Marinibacterium sp.]|nr:glutathione peroxidase [Marinibacterium sp.]